VPLFDPGHRQIGQFGRYLWGITERSNDIIVVIEPDVSAKGLPEYQWVAVTSGIA
jgi:hypothetical protein